MQADSTAAKETVVLTEDSMAENKTSAEKDTYETHVNPKPQESHSSSHDQHTRHGGGGNHAHGQSDPNGNQNQHSTLVEQNEMEVFRNILVNNYRPVQPLNGRVVYRSFPFFNQPIPAKSKTEMKADSIKDPVDGASVVSLSMFSLVVCVLSLNFI